MISATSSQVAASTPTSHNLLHDTRKGAGNVLKTPWLVLRTSPSSADEISSNPPGYRDYGGAPPGEWVGGEAAGSRGDHAEGDDGEEHRVEVEGAGDIAVQQVMQRAGRSAAGALQARQRVKEAGGIKMHGCGIEAIEDRTAHRQNDGGNANDGC